MQYDGFSTGDYHNLLLKGDDETKLIASAMLGIAKKDTLKKIQELKVANPFYIAAGLWIQGFDSAANQILNLHHDKQSCAEFKSFINKNKIRILALLPDNLDGPQSLFNGINSLQDNQIQVGFLGYGQDPGQKPMLWSKHPLAANQPPDAFLANMIEWHHLPVDISNAPFPVIGQTADLDIHVQAMMDILPVFDSIITTDTTEWAMVKKLNPDQRTAVLPTPFAFNGKIAKNNPFLAQERPLDFFMSGILFHHYHPDKIQLITTLLQRLDNTKGLIIDGGLNYPTYLKVQQLSKSSINYYRNNKGMVTRAIDASGQGTIPITPKDNIFNNYVSETSFYSFNSFEEAVKKVQLATSTFSFMKSKSVQKECLKNLNNTETTKRYLRAVAVEAFIIKDQKIKKSKERVTYGLSQMRTRSLYRYWPLPHDKQRNYSKHFKSSLKMNSHQDQNLMLREKTLHFTKQKREQDPFDGKNTSDNLSYYKLRDQWIDLSYKAKNLVFTFNAIRFMHFLGPVCDHDIIMKMIDDVLSTNDKFESPIPEDDVFPPDFIEHSLDYRQYFDLIIENRSKTLSEDLHKLILAAINHIRFIQKREHKDIYRAWCLNPSFGPIVFDYLVSLLHTPIEIDLDTIVRHLSKETPYLKLICTMATNNVGDLQNKISKETYSEIYHLNSQLNSNVIFNETKNLLRGIQPFEFIHKPKSTHDLSISGIKAFFFSDDFFKEDVVTDPFYYDHIHIIFPWPPERLSPHPRVTVITKNSNCSGDHELLPKLFRKEKDLIIFGYLRNEFDKVDAPLIRKLINKWNYSDTLAVFDQEIEQFVLLATNTFDKTIFDMPDKPFVGWKNRVCFDVILMRKIKNSSNVVIYDIQLNDITSTFEFSDLKYPESMKVLIDQKIVL